MPTSIQTYNSFELPREFSSEKASLYSGGFAVIPVNSSTILGYAAIKDTFGNDSLILEVADDREIYNIGVYTLTRSILLLSLILAALLFLLYGILSYRFIGRITDLGKKMREIGECKDFSMRVQEKGSDEISDLAKNINWMLASLESTTEELREYSTHLEGWLKSSQPRLWKRSA